MDSKEAAITTRATSVDFGHRGESSKAPSPSYAFDHGTAEVVDGNGLHQNTLAQDSKKELTWKEKFRFFKTKEFWLILALGQVLALCITGTNTFSTLLVIEGTSIPAFQSFFNYVLLNFIYTGYTIYKYGFKGWCNMLLKDGWKCEWCAYCRSELWLTME